MNMKKMIDKKWKLSVIEFGVGGLPVPTSEPKCRYVAMMHFWSDRDSANVYFESLESEHEARLTRCVDPGLPVVQFTLGKEGGWEGPDRSTVGSPHLTISTPRTTTHVPATFPRTTTNKL